MTPAGGDPQDARRTLFQLANPVWPDETDRIAEEVLGIASDDWSAVSSFVRRPDARVILVLRGGKPKCVPWIRKDYPGKPIHLKAKTDPRFGLLRVPARLKPNRATGERGEGWDVKDLWDRVPAKSGGGAADGGAIAAVMRFLNDNDKSQLSSVYSAFSGGDWVVFPVPKGFLKIRFAFLRKEGGEDVVPSSTEWAFLDSGSDSWLDEVRNELGSSADACLDGLIVCGRVNRPYTSDYDIGAVIWIDVEAGTARADAAGPKRTEAAATTFGASRGVIRAKSIGNVVTDSLVTLEERANEHLTQATKRREKRFLHGANWDYLGAPGENARDPETGELRAERLAIFLPVPDPAGGFQALWARVRNHEEGIALVRALEDYAQAVLCAEIRSRSSKM